MNQSFTPKSLERLYKDVELLYLNIQEDAFVSQLSEINNNILNLTFTFDFKWNDGNIILSNSDLAQKVILRKLNDNIRRIYKDEQSNRRIIISQIKTLLEEECPFWILKSDIKSFYESIDRDRIIQRFKEDAMLSYHSLHLIDKVFTHPLVSRSSGLPRGINISATLSEYYMRKFDTWIKQTPGVYFYARFVDDIIVFVNNKKSVEYIETEFDAKLNLLAKGLQKNTLKTKIFEGLKLSKHDPLTYLGYKFYRNIVVEDKTKAIRETRTIKKLSYKIVNNEDLVSCEDDLQFLTYQISEKKELKNKLKISIADSKVSKIKFRLIKSFLEFSKDGNFTLLEKRIKFLTGNYPIRKNKEKQELRAGIYYNYSQINDLNVLKDLDCFYRGLIFSKKILEESKNKQNG